MKVLLTGAAGYVGWSAANKLILSDSVDEVVVYDNFSRRNYGLLLTRKTKDYGKLTVRVDDILNSRGLRAAAQGADCACHLAALAPSPFADENPHAFDQVNHWGTAEVCYAAEDVGVPRVVYVSSGAVYGFGSNEFETSSEPMPTTSYGASKLAGEKHVQRLSSAHHTVILRSATVYGVNPVARFDTFLNKFALDVVLGRPIQVHGSGEQHRPVVHVEALAEIICAAVEGNIDTGVYNVVAENISMNHSIESMRKFAPSLEAIYLSQQERLRDLMMVPDQELNSLQSRDRTADDCLGELLADISLT
ncbi:MAG: SDR family oxidoreductase [Rhodothermales bacterium]|nr:SDR family oxidoreductase [Rhodothermales bacterium]